VLTWRGVGDVFALADAGGEDGLHAPIRMATNNIAPDRIDKGMLV
jgi:hypothetical protein